MTEAQDKLHMRAEPKRRIVRFKKGVVIGGAAVASAGLLGVTMLALQTPNLRTGQPAEELYNTDKKPTPDGLAALPGDYSEIKLGPPLPGDLGKPILNAGAPAPGMPMPGPSPEEQRLAQEMEAARTSHLFATTNVAAGSVTPSPTAGTPDPAPANTSADLTSQDHKLAFLNGNIDRRTTSPDRVQEPASPYMLQAGAVIPASLITGLRSDLPGQVTAQVTEDVYDSPTGKTLLIPQGSRLIGQYDAQIAFGQSRALLVWNRLIMPNGKSIVLERQPGADTEGYAGLEDEVDNHWGMLFKAALLSTVLSVGTEVGMSGNNNGSLAEAIQQGMSQSINQTGQQVVSRSLNIQPTITIRPGFPVRVMVTHDLVLEPYGA
nr:conjugal transfer protein TraI [Aerococcus urinae]